MTMYLLKIGRDKLQCASLKEARDKHNDLRNESGLGASGWPRCTITAPDGTLYHVSYNGRVWDRNYCRPETVGPAVEIRV